MNEVTKSVELMEAESQKEAFEAMLAYWNQYTSQNAQTLAMINRKKR